MICRKYEQEFIGVRWHCSPPYLLRSMTLFPKNVEIARQYPQRKKFVRNSIPDRRGEYMKLSYKDIRVLQGFRVAGNMNEESMSRMISRNRIDTFRKEGIIQRISYQDKYIDDEKNSYTYRLTNYGKDFCRDELHMRNFANGRHSERHNTALGDIYSKLEAGEQMSCKNELDERDILNARLLELRETSIEDAYKLQEQMKSISLVDMYYTTQEGESVCVEIITNAYSQETIELKEYTAIEVIKCTDYQVVDIG